MKVDSVHYRLDHKTTAYVQIVITSLWPIHKTIRQMPLQLVWWFNIYVQLNILSPSFHFSIYTILLWRANYYNATVEISAGGSKISPPPPGISPVSTSNRKPGIHFRLAQINTT